ncbi:DNA replication/repair protein RecF [Dyella sp. A6]|uniref:DNA replication/repair protein RecF n=1 Tax=Dyella aluminiiresistens TaxID=3069105 RepID=UPI002E7A6C95|nr:DNA replication/repair protein RecF [Dyella sp. A6]
MLLERLKVQGLRCLADLDLSLEPGVQMLVGPNGAGKTSVLEAVYLLSHGRSFRTGSRDALTQRGATELHVFSEWRGEDGSRSRLGLGRNGNRWQARLNGETVPLGELIQACAVVCFDPGSHALIAGGAEERRRFIDWGVFHVEHDFLVIWRRYQRALKQRNALLREGAIDDDALFLPWEHELAETARVLDAWRRRYLDMLRPRIETHSRALLPELGTPVLRYRPGWPEERNLAELLSTQRVRDRARGHTSYGVHRADWSMAYDEAPLREHLSRGQEKLVALTCLMAQANLMALDRGYWPLVCLDDLASELDRPHQEQLLQSLQHSGAQVLITGTDVPPSLDTNTARVFHVEHGTIS